MAEQKGQFPHPPNQPVSTLPSPKRHPTDRIVETGQSESSRKVKKVQKKEPGWPTKRASRVVKFADSTVED
jgi:hypothetical protein